MPIRRQLDTCYSDLASTSHIGGWPVSAGGERSMAVEQYLAVREREENASRAYQKVPAKLKPDLAMDAAPLP
jgi:hypothetical protein